jgi:hypothetical protein
MAPRNFSHIFVNRKGLKIDTENRELGLLTVSAPNAAMGFFDVATLRKQPMGKSDNKASATSLDDEAMEESLKGIAWVSRAQIYE